MPTPGVRRITSADRIDWFRRIGEEIRLGDAVDASSGAAMTVGFARYGAGAQNAWTVHYDEALVVTRGRFAVDSGGGTVEAAAGEVVYLGAGTAVTYRAITDAELVYVTFPHWYEATRDSADAGLLEQFAAEAEGD